jgi:outer membrane lipoprotein-sorting protein
MSMTRIFVPCSTRYFTACSCGLGAVLSALLSVLFATPLAVSQQVHAAQLAVVDEALSTDELRELQSKLNHRTSLAVDFVQTRTSSLRPTRPSISSGKAVFAKPAKFRWAIEKPLGDVLIFDGTSLLNYKPGDKVATRYKTEGERAREIKEIIDFVLDYDALMKRYNLAEATRVGASISLKLKPKTPSQVHHLDISVDGKNFFVQSVNIIFQNKNSSAVQFSNPVAGIDAKSFILPDGLKIVDGL